MAVDFTLKAEIRNDLGKGASRRLRRENSLVPAILYGGDSKPVNLSFLHKDVIKATENEAFFSHIINLKIDGKTEKAVIKAMQRHAFKPVVLHMDFQRVKDTEAIIMHVPLHFLGEDIAPGVKVGGGMISHTMTDVEIRCLPSNLPEYIEVDISKLELGEALHLSDLKLPKGVEIIALSHGADHDHVVVSINKSSGPADDEEISTEEAGEEAASDEEAKKDNGKKENSKEG